MSPVARRQSAHTGRAVAVALVGVAFALGLAFVMANLASRGDVEIKLGDDVFDAGDASDILDEIQEQDAPILFQDVATFRRPIQLDNLGDDPETGWIAFLSIVPTEPDCAVNWDRERNLYVSTCDDAVTFPRTGEGLRAIPVTVEGGDIIVDLQDQADDGDDDSGDDEPG